MIHREESALSSNKAEGKHLVKTNKTRLASVSEGDTHNKARKKINVGNRFYKPKNFNNTEVSYKPRESGNKNSLMGKVFPRA